MAGLVTSAAIVSGELILGMSDGTIIRAGYVQGPAGLQGERGPMGATGRPGLDGNGLLHGAGTPQYDDGKDGDFYIDTKTLKFYGPKTNGHWGSGVALRPEDRGTVAGSAGRMLSHGGGGAGAGGGSGAATPLTATGIKVVDRSVDLPSLMGGTLTDGDTFLVRYAADGKTPINRLVIYDSKLNAGKGHGPGWNWGVEHVPDGSITGQVPVWDEVTKQWTVKLLNTPIIFIGSGAWVAGDVLDPAKNYGMPKGTAPDPQKWPPQDGDQYIDSSSGSITVFTTVPVVEGAVLRFEMPTGLAVGTVISLSIQAKGPKAVAAVPFTYTTVAADKVATALAANLLAALQADPAIAALGALSLTTGKAANDSVRLSAGAGTIMASADQGIDVVVVAGGPTTTNPAATLGAMVAKRLTLKELEDCADLGKAVDGQVPVWSATNNRWQPRFLNSPIVYLGNGAWTAADVADKAKNYGMAAGTNPDPQQWVPQPGDQYIDTATGTITVFTGAVTGTGGTGLPGRGGTGTAAGGGATQSLSSLSDTVITAPSDGQTLQWKKDHWENVAAKEIWMVGETRTSALDEAGFNALLDASEKGKWALADGRTAVGTPYATATGRTVLPDLRSTPPATANNAVNTFIKTG